MKTTTPPTKLHHLHVGAAGEHYVAHRLSLFGIDVGLVPAKTAAIDLLCYRGGRSASLQVKTRGPSVGPGEPIDMHPGKVGFTDFLAVVILRGDETSAGRPFAYVLPRLAARAWVDAFNDGNAKRPCTRMNLASRAVLEPHREAWHLVAAELGHIAA